MRTTSVSCSSNEFGRGSQRSLYCYPAPSNHPRGVLPQLQFTRENLLGKIIRGNDDLLMRFVSGYRLARSQAAVFRQSVMSLCDDPDSATKLENTPTATISRSSAQL